MLENFISENQTNMMELNFCAVSQHSIFKQNVGFGKVWKSTPRENMVDHAAMEFCGSVQAWLAEDLSQIVEGYLEFIKLKVWKPIS